jgi:hypothetical protein
MKLDHKMLIPSFYPKQLSELLNYFEINEVVIKNGYGVKTDDIIEMNNEEFTKLKIKFSNNYNFETLYEKWHDKNLRVVN